MPRRRNWWRANLSFWLADISVIGKFPMIYWYEEVPLHYLSQPCSVMREVIEA